MMLCLDCGNTRIKWGLCDPHGAGTRWLAHGAIATAAAETLTTSLPAEFSTAYATMPVIACNVAAAAVRVAITLQLPATRWLSAAAEQGGIRNSYVEPQRLGADRWAALIGARTHADGSLVVVSAGTATTIDLLTDNGTFIGGVILPGIDLMHRSLARSTAGLDVAKGHYEALPRTTEDAITSGVMHAALGAIERMARQLGNDARCVVTGGAAPQLLPHLTLPCIDAPLLVLEGLAAVGWHGLAEPA